MKKVWVWLVFVLLYGVFSMKGHAASMLQLKVAGGVVSGAYRLSH